MTHTLVRGGKGFLHYNILLLSLHTCQS